MSKKEEFKNFILNRPELIDYVESNKTTWQKLYEIYDLYGKDSDVWNKYKNTKIVDNNIDIRGIINQIKNINLDSLEENLSSIQKVVGLVSEFTKKDEENKEIIKKEEKIDNIYGDDNEN